MARILILREREAALSTARLVAAMGHEPVLLPLQTIVPLDPALPEGPFCALIATSANALRGGALKRLRHLPVLAVGEASAKAARAAGWAAEIAGSGTGAAMVERAGEIHATSGLPLLYAAGRVRTDGLESALRHARIPFETVETYDTRDVEPAPGEIEAAFEAPIDAALLLSVGQARAFSRLLERAGERAARPPTPLCLSERVRQALPPPLIERAVVSRTSELSALLARYDTPKGGEG